MQEGYMGILENSLKCEVILSLKVILGQPFIL